jgi:hypothetical protein
VSAGRPHGAFFDLLLDKNEEEAVESWSVRATRARRRGGRMTPETKNWTVSMPDGAVLHVTAPDGLQALGEALDAARAPVPESGFALTRMAFEAYVAEDLDTGGRYAIRRVAAEA